MTASSIEQQATQHTPRKLGSLGSRSAEPLVPRSWHQSQVAQPEQPKGKRKGSRFTSGASNVKLGIDHYRHQHQTPTPTPTLSLSLSHIHLRDAAQETRQEPKCHACAFHRVGAKRRLSFDPRAMGGHAASAEPHLRLQDRRVSWRFCLRNATAVADSLPVASTLRSCFTRKSTSASFPSTTKPSRSL
jgi:hypothetical protein